MSCDLSRQVARISRILPIQNSEMSISFTSCAEASCGIIRALTTHQTQHLFNCRCNLHVAPSEHRVLFLLITEYEPSERGQAEIFVVRQHTIIVRFTSLFGALILSHRQGGIVGARAGDLIRDVREMRGKIRFRRREVYVNNVSRRATRHFLVVPGPSLF